MPLYGLLLRENFDEGWRHSAKIRRAPMLKHLSNGDQRMQNRIHCIETADPRVETPSPEFVIASAHATHTTSSWYK